MRILHTADWHLGQTLHGVSRAYEHARFLAWLERTIDAEEIDALVIAGDIFDSANPGPPAQHAYYQFLASCRRRFPHLDIVVVGGNHDSPQRLDAPRELFALEAIRIHVVGGMPRDEAGAIDAERVIVPLHRRGGEIGAWLVAVPFLRRGELPYLDGEDGSAPGGEEKLAEAYRALYRELTAAASARREQGQALIATGHCYMTGGRVSELSERKIQVGNQHALPLDVFPDELAYVALGHLHQAQSVLGKESVRYSGSPIPLSLAEREYKHQVLVIELDGERLRSIHPIYVPRPVEMLSVPEEHAPLAEVLPLLRALPRGPEVKSRNGAGQIAIPFEDDPVVIEGGEEGARPYLEVRVLLDAVSPRLRRDIEEALEGSWARLLRIDVRHRELVAAPGEPAGLVGGARVRELGAISPEDVFAACYRRQRGEAPLPPELLALFHELVESVQSGPGSNGAAT